MQKSFRNLHLRLIILCFLQFFSWGSWLITLGTYLSETLNFSGEDIGFAFATAGIASLFMPALLGFVADRWINAERVLGGTFILCGLSLVLFGLLPSTSPVSLSLGIILACNLFFMPTLSLCNTVAYSALNKNNEDVVKVFPPIRVWGTIGFIMAMWINNLLGMNESPEQFFIAGGVAFLAGLYSFTLPSCNPEGKGKEKKGILSILGLDSFSLFKDAKMATFLIFSMLLGCALQLTNAYGNLYLDAFKNFPEYTDGIAGFVVKNPNFLLSISQISETVFILTIPFFLKRLGIRWVIFMSLIAWTLRFGLLGIGNPGWPGITALLLSMIVYGMAFDFFNISGSIYVENRVEPSMRAGAQGLFVLMTNGVGTIVGSLCGGYIVKLMQAQEDPTRWPYVWFIFACYAFIVAILFLIFFREDKGIHKDKKLQEYCTEKA